MMLVDLTAPAQPINGMPGSPSVTTTIDSILKTVSLALLAI
jgi:hypothetical protein